MYANDAILCFSHKDVRGIKAAMAEDIDGVALWLQINQLVINLRKDQTESMVFGTSTCLAKLENSSLCIHIGGNAIGCALLYVYLGVKLDPTLSFSQQLHCTFKNISGKLKMLKKIRPFLSVYDCSITIVL